MLEFLNTPGKRWQALRKEHGWTLREAAEKIAAITGRAYGYNSLARIERDEIRPSIEVAEAAAEIYSSTMDWMQCRSWALTYARPGNDEAHCFSQEADEAARLIDEQPGDCRERCLKAVKATIEDYSAARRQNQRDWERLLRLVESLGGAALRDKLLARLPDGEAGGIDVSLDDFLAKLNGGK